jgi:hypothetical protein
MSGTKFLGPDSFREFAPPADEDGADVAVGAMVVLDSER